MIAGFTHLFSIYVGRIFSRARHRSWLSTKPFLLPKRSHSTEKKRENEIGRSVTLSSASRDRASTSSSLSLFLFASHLEAATSNFSL